MKAIQYTVIFFAVALLDASSLFAQGQHQEEPDSTNLYLGEAIGRSQIDPAELPQEILDSLKSSKYGSMDMIAVYKVDVVPGKETATDSALRGTEAPNSQRPYRMKNDTNEALDIDETYYQDTYEDLPNQQEGTAQENATGEDMREDIDPTDEAQVTQKQKPENVDTYYEIEVNGASDDYVLLFSENGHLTYTSPQGM